MKARYSLLGCLAAVLLGSCAAPQESGKTIIPPDVEGYTQSCGQLDTEHQLVLNLVEELIDEGRLHAALANLEQFPDRSPEVRLYKARVKRMLGQPDAEALYQRLVDSCVKASAYHGLGQLAAARGHFPESRRYLREAARLRPTDHAIRNDLGYVYLYLREREAARFELLTALELDESDELPIDNLLTLLIYEGKWSEANQLVRSSGASPEQLQRAERRARQMQLEDNFNKGASRTAVEQLRDPPSQERQPKEHEL